MEHWKNENIKLNEMGFHEILKEKPGAHLILDRYSGNPDLHTSYSDLCTDIKYRLTFERVGLRLLSFFEPRCQICAPECWTRIFYWDFCAYLSSIK